MWRREKDRKQHQVVISAVEKKRKGGGVTVGAFNLKPGSQGGLHGGGNIKANT